MYNPNSHFDNIQFNQQVSYSTKSIEFGDFSYGENVYGNSNSVNSNYNQQNSIPPTNEEDYENEPPLLEELGVNFGHIIERTKLVLNPLKETTQEVLDDTDLAGPLVFCLTFGSALVLAGKLHFNYIYGLGMFASIFMFILLNLMSPQGVSFTCIISVLGYCMLPMCGLSFFAIINPLKSFIGAIISALIILWSAGASSKLFVRALNMQHQRVLVAYPCALVYTAFALLTIF